MKEEWDDMKLPKGMTILPWFIYALLAGAFVGCVFLAGNVKAGEADVLSVVIGHNKLSLYSTPCELEGWFKKWKKAEWFWNGDVVPSCWRVQQTPDGPVVYTIDALGDVGSIPPEAFKKEEGV